MLRRAAFAGKFYPKDAVRLRNVLRELTQSAGERSGAYAAVVPHSAYHYSGRVVGETFASIDLPRRFALLCPNHTGSGAPISLEMRGRWETPLGEVSIDQELAEAVLDCCLAAQECPSAHRQEHGVEVQLPFLQSFLNNDFGFVPISVGTGRLDSLLALGEALAEAVRSLREPILLIASSDFTHFETEEVTRRKDALAIEHICRLDAHGLFEAVRSENISMCGYGPTIAVLRAARKLGAQNGELICYGHSGEVSGDRSSVVGYAGLVIH